MSSQQLILKARYMWLHLPAPSLTTAAALKESYRGQSSGMLVQSAQHVELRSYPADVHSQQEIYAAYGSMALLAPGLCSYLPQSNNFIVFQQYWQADGWDISQVGLALACPGLHSNIHRMTM